MAELADRLYSSMTATFDLLAVYAGEQLGWYAALAKQPSTPAELAAATATSERYAREWLEHQAVGGILEVDDGRYMLPAEHAEVLLDPESLLYAAPLARFAASLPLSDVLEAYGTGGGVPWEAYGADGREAQAALNRPLFTRLLTQEWLPAIPDVHERLQQPGARVAELACGGGWASIAIARAYPHAHVEGFDLDEASIELARANAATAGVEVRFEVRDIAAATGAYDLVCVFEAIHDLARPVEALAAMRAAAGADGAVIVMDERTGDAEHERLLYGFSLFCCLPTGMSETPSAATGTVMRPDVMRRYALEAGFDDCIVLGIEHDGFRFYRLT
jgi:2-polyprenyl-3-methyl-5-hydroxy-6-metoxy-1,4-benzoquinol methylase